MENQLSQPEPPATKEAAKKPPKAQKPKLTFAQRRKIKPLKSDLPKTRTAILRNWEDDLGGVVRVWFLPPAGYRFIQPTICKGREASPNAWRPQEIVATLDFGNNQRKYIRLMTSDERAAWERLEEWHKKEETKFFKTKERKLSWRLNGPVTSEAAAPAPLKIQAHVEKKTTQARNRIQAEFDKIRLAAAEKWEREDKAANEQKLKQ
jgi:hypothetical protein